MGVTINYEALYGVNTSDRAIASLLTIDGFTILLDCGWTSAFDVAYITTLAERVKSVDVVLLSHPDIPHLGALPYLVGRCGLSAPIVSTLPVWRMGQMFMYDAYQSLVASRQFDTFNLDDVDAAFEMTPDSPRYSLIKYQQHYPLDFIEGGQGITVTPYPAGHMLGGTIWNVKKGTESIVYAVDFNHRRERHLKPISFTAFSRPSHLIVGASQVLTPLATKNTDLVSHITTVIQQGGDVLIPVDSAGRVIELAIQLTDAWTANPSLSKASLVVLNEFALRTFEFARSMIEWMSDEVVRRFDISRDNLFDFKKKPLRLCQTRSELDKVPSPKVVLASSPSLEYGFARDLFVEWCVIPRNAVVLVDQPEIGSLYAHLFHRVVNSNADVNIAQPWTLSLKVEAKVQLSGEELQQWRESEKARKLELEAEAKRALEEERLLEAQNLKLADPDGDVKMEIDSEGKEDPPIADETCTEFSSTVLQAPGSPASASDFDEKTEQALSEYLDLVEDASWTRIPVDRIVSSKSIKQPTWDRYGEVIDTARFMIGEDPGEGAPEQHIAIDGSDQGQTEAEVDKEVIPTKYVEENVDLRVACRLFFVDCAGLSDGESLKRLVKKMEPRRVVIVKGTKEESEHLRGFVIESVFSNELMVAGKENASSLALQDVVCPAVKEVVDITTNMSVHDLLLKDSLVERLKWSQVGGNAVAHVDAILQADDNNKGYALDILSPVTETEEPEFQKAPQNTSHDIADTMEVNMTGEDMKMTGEKGHPTVFIGTVMLNRLRDSLAKEGMRVEFVGGILCIENEQSGAVVLVKKLSAQNIVMDGTLSEEYFTARDILYRELIVPM